MKKALLVFFTAISLSSLAHANLSCEASVGGEKLKLKNDSSNVVVDKLGDDQIVVSSMTPQSVDISITQKDGKTINVMGIIPLYGYVRFYLGPVAVFCLRD